MTSHRPARTASSATSGPHRVSSRSRAAATCPPSPGSSPSTSTATTRPRPGQRWPGLGDEPDQRDHARPGLEAHRDLPRLGRLGWLLRPRRPADRRRQRLRPARSRARDQPVREAWLHRSSDAQLRRLPEVHRGRLPWRTADRPEDRRAARPATDSARERARSSATSAATSTSRRPPGSHSSYRPIPCPGLTSSAPRSNLVRRP